ncbi:MAG TPA: hypothetical protein VMH38_07515, partial [Thermoplasmata archaeon]|nr:hypothetical protein [Thermoplasmata archaeon]
TNGSYLFTIPNVLDYVPQVRSGSFRVAGAGQVFVIPFVRASVPVTFTVSGLPTNAAWSVRLGNNSTALTYDISAGFREPNGTYQFNVSAPSGFVAVPSHGWVNVSGTPINISVKIVSLAPASTPPLWDLAFPALLVTAVAALAGYGTFLLIGARRRRRSGAKR